MISWLRHSSRTEHTRRSAKALAVFVLLVRFSISQMAVVDPAERSAAAGVTGIARTIGAACSPLLTGLFLSAGLFSLPFFAAGSLKIAYDLALYRSFRRVQPPEEEST